MTVGRMRARTRLAAAIAIASVVAIVACILAPLRHPSGDTVPGRLGGAVLRCGGDFDLARVDWIRREIQLERMPYYVQKDATGQYSSVFGPIPAVVSALALPDFGTGDKISEVTLRERDRYAAASCLGLAVALLVLAAAARCGPLRSALVGGLAAASFAGAATIGQAMWQATTALPFLTGALAVLAWRERFSRVALATPALLVVAVMMRPTIAPLALGVGLAWVIATRERAERSAIRSWIVATALALVAALPLVAWNVVHLESPFPVGQFTVNARASESVFSVENFGVGFAGLLVSPGRGLVFFAPILIVGVISALRSRTRSLQLIAGGIVLQILVMATFHAWHGGLGYGPRFLTEASWIGIWLALGTGMVHSRRWTIIAGVAVAITIVVGQLGLWRFHNEQWEVRRKRDGAAAFWDFTDSPITATFRSIDGLPTSTHMPPTQNIRCFTTGQIGAAFDYEEVPARRRGR